MKIAIIGGGLGGLSAAVTLAKAGVDVQVFEKNDHFGGKMMAVDESGYHFDFGPNTMTMPDVFQDVIRQGGGSARELPFKKLLHHTRNVFHDGSTFDFSTDRKYMKRQLEQRDPESVSGYDDFLNEVERLYHLSNQYFLHRTFTGWKDYLSPSLTKGFAQVRPLESMNHFFKRYFNDSGVLQALNRYSTYVGSNPYATPATFAMIAHLELNDGVYYVEGGNTRIAEEFARAARNQGASLHLNAQVTRILTKGKKTTGIELESGERFEADRVILNGDLLQALPDLLSDQERSHLSNRKIDSFDPSISAFVIMAGLDKRLDSLHHHQVFFSHDYKKEFLQLQNGQYAEDPTIYICTSSKSDPSVSPKGDNCFILVNAPAIREGMCFDKESYKQLIYDRLAKHGVPIQQHLSYERVISPEEIEQSFGAYRGALYGPSSNTKLQAFMRPFNKSQDVDGLYFCGGSTHPGGGSPMVVLSGQNVAHHIIGKKVSIE
ncbi:phytoene desaturase [Halobacillus fulvus]|nr:phytoene desaturase [Halobacillus fulvus]